MKSTGYKKGNSEKFNNILANGQPFDYLLAEQYRQVHLKLITGWADFFPGQTVLKTDLFAEAMCPARSFLWNIPFNDGVLVGMDVSRIIASKARSNAPENSESPSPFFINCDVRHLPYTDNSFDLVISDSTLDHFARVEEIDTALAELNRVLKPGGTMIITMDNKGNITDPLFRLWKYLGLSPFYIGQTYDIDDLRQALEETGIHVDSSTAIIHNPRFFTKAIIWILRKIGSARFDSFIRRGLEFFDGLEDSRIKYLTAQFIAVKAVKALAE